MYQLPKFPTTQSIFKCHVILSNPCQISVRALLCSFQPKKLHNSPQSPPAPIWHFPCLLQSFNYTHPSLLVLTVLSSPAQDLLLSDCRFVLVDVQHKAPMCRQPCVARGLSQPIPYGCLHPWTGFCC